MYSNYNSLRENIQKEIESQKSVLNKFPEHISRPITQSCSKYLAQFTSCQLPLKSDKQQTQDANSLMTSMGNALATPAASSTSSNNNSSQNSEATSERAIIQLDTVEQVNWTLENIMYGLTLSLEYQDIIKDCWLVYHDWLTVLLDEQKQFLPQAIKDDPINYSKKMLWHLYSLFIPRKDAQAIKSNELTHIMVNISDIYFYIHHLALIKIKN